MCQHSSFGGFMLNCCSHFLPNLALPVTPFICQHVNRTHMEKTKPGFITVFSPVVIDFGIFAAWQNWTTPCHGQSAIFQVKTLKSETCTEAQDYCAGKLISHLMFFSCFFPFLLQRGLINHVLYTSGRGFSASPQGGRRAWWEKHDGISL